MKHLIIAFSLLLFINDCKPTPFKKCEGQSPPTNLRIKGCEDFPCKLYRGKNVTAEWDFIISAPTKVLIPKVTAFVLSTTVSYPFAQKNACETLIKGECPLNKGEEVTYSLNMPVLSIYPQIKLSIQFQFIDDNGNVQVCFIVPAKVV
ncbi:NPC intracellular cholesterol transporter 2-like [Leptopilina heterotoma]|uniref:NPC intracellular cholesterol transporter 2-like n=1 Tax=Leptopilina heterotoma TaxID=63436 RepID=UPI001CA891CC|nr:NPC intracellular cholesterol transporter 2-like [Leptopilina heterotoma]